MIQIFHAQWASTWYLFTILFSWIGGHGLRLLRVLQLSLTALVIAMFVSYLCMNAAVSFRSFMYNGVRHVAMYGVCRTSIWFSYRGSVCKKYENLWALFSTETGSITGVEFENLGFSLGSVMNNNGIFKQIPYTLLEIQSAVTILRRTVMFSTLDSEIKEDLETHFGTYMIRARNVIKGTQRFTGGIEATVNVVLLQSKVALNELADIERRTLQKQSLEVNVWARG